MWSCWASLTLGANVDGGASDSRRDLVFGVAPTKLPRNPRQEQRVGAAYVMRKEEWRDRYLCISPCTFGADDPAPLGHAGPPLSRA